jgi:cyclopropane fatty-acyl-phospholipid synthase-like methyltransferase
MMILLSLVETCFQLRVSVQAGDAERQVCFLLCCRDCPGLGSYDKVVSIEMIEAVGHEHLNSYFAVINAALKPGGKAVIQVGGGDKRQLW